MPKRARVYSAVRRTYFLSRRPHLLEGQSIVNLPHLVRLRIALVFIPTYVCVFLFQAGSSNQSDCVASLPCHELIISVFT